MMQDRRELESWADPELLAGQVTNAFISSTIVWGSGGIKENELTAAVQYGTGLVLAGVVTGDNVLLVGQRIKAAQELLARFTETFIGTNAVFRQGTSRLVFNF